tara:strand:+ start:755 stop:976 length:222 start_codon:yes stop_codon:yes gene_type:complete
MKVHHRLGLEYFYDRKHRVWRGRREGDTVEYNAYHKNEFFWQISHAGIEHLAEHLRTRQVPRLTIQEFNEIVA